MDWIVRNIEEIQRKIAQAAKKSGRTAKDVTLVAVTKSVAAEVINQAIAAGISDIGENRVQEAREKFSSLAPVGHLQTNKVNQAIELFDLIHSVDSLRLGEAIARRAARQGKVMPILVQVNISGEATKYGVALEETLPLVRALSGFVSLEVAGLMTICPAVEDPEEVRPYFRQMRLLKEEIEQQGFPLKYLSMGMSGDYEVAVEEGANMVRIGTALFQKRCDHGA